MAVESSATDSDSAAAAGAEEKDIQDVSMGAISYRNLEYWDRHVGLGQMQQVEHPLRDVAKAYLAVVQ